jgi:hypothetical protein
MNRRDGVRRLTNPPGQAAMPKKKRRSKVEIATKLAQVNDLATQGKSQREIADQTHRGGARIAELQLENSRLRQRAIDLMRKIIKREEAAQSQIRRVRGMS